MAANLWISWELIDAPRSGVGFVSVEATVPALGLWRRIFLRSKEIQ